MAKYFIRSRQTSKASLSFPLRWKSWWLKSSKPLQDSLLLVTLHMKSTSSLCRWYLSPVKLRSNLPCATGGSSMIITPLKDPEFPKSRPLLDLLNSSWLEMSYHWSRSLSGKLSVSISHKLATPMHETRQRSICSSHYQDFRAPRPKLVQSKSF